MLATYDALGSQGGTPEHTLFAGLSYQRERFDDFISGGMNTSPLSSNRQTRVLAGLKTNYKGLVIGEIGVGLFNYDYDSASASAITNFDLYADLKYLITRKSTIGLDIERSVNQDNEFVRGFIDTDVALSLEHEFLHNIYGTVEGTYSNNDFISGSREDDTYGIGLGFRYLHSPRFESRLRASYQTQDSSISGGGYDNSSILYSLISRI